MTRSYTVHYKDYELAPDFLEQAAALHNIEPALYIKRCIADKIRHMYPEITTQQDFDSLEEFFIGHGFRKPVKAGWQHIVVMAEPGNMVLAQLRALALSKQCRAEDLALQFLTEAVARFPAAGVTNIE